MIGLPNKNVESGDNKTIAWAFTSANLTQRQGLHNLPRLQKTGDGFESAPFGYQASIRHRCLVRGDKAIHIFSTA